MKSKIANLGVVSIFLLTNTFVIAPNGSAYAIPTEEEPPLAALVQPLSVSYVKDEHGNIVSDDGKNQSLTTADLPLASPDIMFEVEVSKMNPELHMLSQENTFELTEEEYMAVVAKGRSYDVLKSIEIAYADVGNSYPTGWSMRGECIISVSFWLKSAGATWGQGGTPVNNYTTAERVPLENLQAGDVIQYIHLESPHSWISGVHTVLITGNNWDGTYKIVESNAEGPGLVSKNDNWVPSPPAGFEAAAFRFQ